MDSSLWAALDVWYKNKNAPQIEVGRIESVNENEAWVRISGSLQAVQCAYDRDAKLQVGKSCLLIRGPRVPQWIVVTTFGTPGRSDGASGSLISRAFVELAPPANLAAMALPGHVFFSWDSVPQANVTFEVQESATEDDAAPTVRVTRGSYYLYQGDTATSVRVRSIDDNFRKSGWSPWVVGTPGRAWFVDGRADAIQLRVQGHSSQTAKLATFETSAGTEKVTIDNNGTVALQQLVMAATSNVTVSGGTITIASESIYRVDGTGASTDLSTLNGGVAGKLVVLRPYDAAHAIVLKHNVGNVMLFGSADVTLDATHQGVFLLYDGGLSKWIQIGGSGSGTGSGSGSGVGQALFTHSGSVYVTQNPIRIYNQMGETKTITKVFLSASTAPTGADLIVDIHKNGTTIFTTQSNRPRIVASANTGYSTTIEVNTWLDGDYLEMHIDQIGSTVAGANLTVHVVYEVV